VLFGDDVIRLVGQQYIIIADTTVFAVAICSFSDMLA
jgi:hypothetical protein